MVGTAEGVWKVKLMKLLENTMNAIRAILSRAKDQAVGVELLVTPTPEAYPLGMRLTRMHQGRLHTFRVYRHEPIKIVYDTRNPEFNGPKRTMPTTHHRVLGVSISVTPQHSEGSH